MPVSVVSDVTEAKKKRSRERGKRGGHQRRKNTRKNEGMKNKKRDDGERMGGRNRSHGG